MNRLREALVVDHIDLAHHAEVFDGQDGKLALAQFVKAGAFCKDRHAELLEDQVLDGGSESIKAFMQV